MTRPTTAPRRLHGLMAALLAGLLVLAGQTAPAAAAEVQTTTVAFSDTTTVRGTALKTFYEGDWAKNSTHTWATGGAAFEIPFTGETVSLSGRKATTNGTADVFVDGVKVGSADYRGARSTTTVPIFSHTGLEPGDHLLRVVTVGYINHASAEFTATVPVDERERLTAALDRVSAVGADDVTADSWAGFSSVVARATAVRDAAASTDAELTAALAELEAAEDALVRISGLREMLDQYRTRVPSAYTAASWAPFAAATVTAGEVLDDPSATAAAVVAAKNGLQATAAALEPLSNGSLETIENNRFWLDTAGDPIFSQGGGIFRFGDRYYWYGVEYTGSQLYYDNPTRTYTRAGEVDFVAVTAYSSDDLVNWTFENDVATRDTALHIPTSKDVTGSYFSDMETLADAVWIGRLGVAYNESTGRYVLLTQFESPDPARVSNAGVLFLSGDSPTADFEYANLQTHIPGVYENPNKPGWNQGTGDQTVFTDDDGSDYLVFSYRDGRSRTYVGKISDADSLSVETAVEVYRGAGREGNAMFKLDGQYYVASSDLHGWNTSQTYLVRSLEGRIQGPYSSMYVLPGTEKDYSHVTQSGFFLTVQGTEQDTVIYAGDRWADFAWNGLGYNQWVPLSGTDADVRFNSLSEWELNARTGEWEVGAGNNWILNPDFAADRIAVSTVTGWTQVTDPSSSTTGFVSNPSPGADGSRFALRLGAAQAFSGGVQQENEVPAGVYGLSARVDNPGGLSSARIVVTGADGIEHVTDLPATSGWADVTSSEFALPAGTARVAILATGAGGRNVTVDALALRQRSVDTAALSALVADTAGIIADSVTADSWAPFAAARANAEAVLAGPAPQAAVDEAVSRLEAARAALVSAVRSIVVAPSTILAPVGAAFDPASIVVTATLADGTTRVLAAADYQVSGFDTRTAGEKTATVAVVPRLLATGSAGVQARLDVRVLAAWSATAVYQKGDSVLFTGSEWRASWYSKNQTPGDVNGPWQQITTAPDGTAVWTASRIFDTGEIVVHQGKRFQAKWWTRNQAPGDPYGPWKPLG
ncbi:carbohydrate-binding protein [Rathayibacter sp. VKM Ac-2754]|uniref:carbohydrate-binding protein n=1 Tax=Rathayibacter sp. VKM Ac-2754 TaxID=2609251 RepID=UPI00135CA3B6|nr:carbohydrate-binding protein [Rathayibacter sp. VKM Ac-2754]MWV58987.1 family 43 glycosylhydrolase [Rathayibacter sp. VKM Ac-2754]